MPLPLDTDRLARHQGDQGVMGATLLAILPRSSIPSLVVFERRDAAP